MPWLRFESNAYWAVSLVTFLGVAVWETLSPKFRASFSTERRWRNHAIIAAVSTIVSMIVLRASLVAAALSVANSPYGLLNKPLIPFAARFVLAVCLLDLVRYAAHRAMHSVAWLWRFHQVHHSDPDFDVATGLRVHPGETIFLQLSTFLFILFFSPPVSAVLATELLDIFLSFYGHSNIRCPKWMETPLRLVLVTPDLHRIHHSEELSEQNLNFGDVFPWWDRLFGTYVAEPSAGENGIVVGLKGLRNPEILDVSYMLRMPFLPDQAIPMQNVHSTAAPRADLLG